MRGVGCQVSEEFCPPEKLFYLSGGPLFGRFLSELVVASRFLAESYFNARGPVCARFRPRGGPLFISGATLFDMLARSRSVVVALGLLTLGSQCSNVVNNEVHDGHKGKTRSKTSAL
jgi:hypothetical protein